MGPKLIIVCLLALLGGALYVGYLGLAELHSADVPTWIYVMFGFGALLTILVGSGLMALVFYSARRGYDEPPQLDREHRPQ